MTTDIGQILNTSFIAWDRIRSFVWRACLVMAAMLPVYGTLALYHLAPWWN